MSKKNQHRIYRINDKFSYRFLFFSMLYKLLGYQIHYYEDCLEVILGIKSYRSQKFSRKIVWFFLKKICDSITTATLPRNPLKFEQFYNFDTTKYKTIYYCEQVLDQVFTSNVEAKYYSNLTKLFANKLVRVAKPVYQTKMANRTFANIKMYLGLDSLSDEIFRDKSALFVSVYSTALFDKRIMGDRLFLLPTINDSQNSTNDMVNIESLKKLSAYKSDHIFVGFIDHNSIKCVL